MNRPEPELDSIDRGPVLERPRRRSTPPWPWIAAAVVIVAAAAFYFWRSRAAEPSVVPDAPPVASAPAERSPAAPAPIAAAEPLPPLEASDELVRQRAAELSDAPELAAWLSASDLVRRFAAAVVTVADGGSPRQILPFLRPAGAFMVREEGGRTVIDPASYARYDRTAAVFSSLDAGRARALIGTLRPLLAQAHGEIAHPSTTFDGALERAIAHLLEVPVPPDEVEVFLSEGLYRYADPRLQSLSAAQKHLLRMGPENVRRVQAKLRQLRGA